MSPNPHSREEIDRCIRVLEDVAVGKVPPDQALMSIQGTVKGLRNGEKVFAMVEKLVKSNNADRAAKLLKVVGESGGRSKRKARFVFLAVLNILIIGGAVTMMPRCNGAYDPAMAAINACPAAVELIGSPISQSFVGLACGSSESSGAYGNASWQIPVSGPKDSGRFEFAGRNQGAGWHLDRAMLTVGDRSVSVWPCGAAQATSEMRLSSGMNLSGTVISSVGKPGILPNSACTVNLSPTPKDAFDSGYNCHITVQCGAAVIYGWEGSGYTRCTVVNGVAVRADDITGAAAGDDPRLTLDIAGKSCVVSDDGTAPFTVIIALSGM